MMTVIRSMFIRQTPGRRVLFCLRRANRHTRLPVGASAWTRFLLDIMRYFAREAAPVSLP